MSGEDLSTLSKAVTCLMTDNNNDSTMVKQILLKKIEKNSVLVGSCRIGTKDGVAREFNDFRAGVSVHHKVSGFTTPLRVQLHHAAFYVATGNVSVPPKMTLSHRCGRVACGTSDHLAIENTTTNNDRKRCHNRQIQQCPHVPTCVLDELPRTGQLHDDSGVGIDNSNSFDQLTAEHVGGEARSDSPATLSNRRGIGRAPSRQEAQAQ